MPSAVARTEPVGVFPSSAVYEHLQPALHDVGGLLCYHASHGIGDEHPHHIALLFQLALQPFKLHAARSHEKCVSLRSAQLWGDNRSDAERVSAGGERLRVAVQFSLLFDVKAESWLQYIPHPLSHPLNLQSGVVVSLRLPVAHLYEQFAVGDVEVVVSQMFLKHDVVVYYRATQTVCAVSIDAKVWKKGNMRARGWLFLLAVILVAKINDVLLMSGICLYWQNSVNTTMGIYACVGQASCPF